MKLEIKRNEHGVYLYMAGLNVGYTNEKDIFIVDGFYKTKQEFYKSFPEAKQTKKRK